jgi:RNA polymerase-binding transcription factor DksA
MATKKQKSPKAKASAPKKKAAAKPARKSVAKKAPAPKKKAAPVAKKIVSKKPAKKAPVVAKPAKSNKPAKPAKSSKPAKVSKPAAKAAPPKPAVKLTPFLVRQKARLLALKDTLLDSMNGVAKDSLRSRAEGSEASAFGMHQADAGSDAYDRDFALSLLSQEQDSLYEIDQALKRVETGSYGVCEISGKAIPHPRLEALPFTRYTVECQTEIEKRNRYQRVRQPVASLFGLSDEDGDSDDDDHSSDSKD